MNIRQPLRAFETINVGITLQSRRFHGVSLKLSFSTRPLIEKKKRKKAIPCKKCFRSDLNWRPSACEADVLTTTLRKPCRPRHLWLVAKDHFELNHILLIKPGKNATLSAFPLWKLE